MGYAKFVIMKVEIRASQSQAEQMEKASGKMSERATKYEQRRASSS
jgi:hypothetical protein